MFITHWTNRIDEACSLSVTTHILLHSISLLNPSSAADGETNADAECDEGANGGDATGPNA